jgi:large subunit ribosomal protein L21
VYAVIKAGGKQQKVKPGDIIEVELMHGAGDTVTFHPLLIVDDDGKTHYGKDAERGVVTARPVGEQKGDKIHIIKYKNKTGYARRAGHRQLMTLLEIGEVSLGTPAKRPAPRRSTAKAAPEAEAGAETESGSDAAAEAPAGEDESEG